MGADLPDTSQLFDGYLIGMVLDAGATPGGGGTNPGQNPGGVDNPTVTVTFDGGAADAENVPAPMQVVVGSAFDLPAGPTRVGFAFDGWSSDEIGENLVAGASVTVTRSTTLTAQWQAKTEYTIGFDTDGGAFVPADGYSFVGTMISFYGGDDVRNIVLGSSSEKTNKDFIGWLNEASDIMYDNNTNGAIQFNGNVTLKAQWADTKYSITYDLDGGTGMGTNGGSYAINENVILSTEIPTKEGFVFDGWICSVKQNVEPIKAGATYLMPGENTTLTAVWVDEFTVSYNAGLGTGTVPPPVKVKAGATIQIASGAGLSRTDYNFAGWTVGSTTYQANQDYIVKDDVEFTADWKSAEYFVSYLGAQAPVDTDSYAAGATVTVKAPNPETRAGYQFGGYESSLGGIVQPGATFVMPSGGVTLTTIWTKLSKLTLVIEGSSENGMTLVYDENNIIGGDTFVKEYLNVPSGFNIYDYLFTTPRLAYENEEYYFRGWVNADNHAITYGEAYVGPINMPDGDATFIVAWEGNPYEISFNLNGGSGSFTKIEFFPGDNVTLGGTVPTITGGQVFTGWERSDSGIMIAANGTIINAPANNIELKAIWANPEFTIEFDLNGGSNGPENVTVPWTPTGTYTISSMQPSKVGHSFLNWGSTLGGTIDLSTVTAGSTITLTASYQPYVWNVFYNANGGTGTTSDSTAYNHGTEVTVMANGFTYAGYEFVNWNTSEDGTGTSYAAGAKFNITAHTTLYAQWEELQAQEYTITFTMQDTFNGVAAGTVDVKMMLTSGESFTFNNANFTEYFTGFKPYDTSAKFGSTYTKTITAGETTAISGGSISVYGFVTVGSDEYIKISTAAGFNMIKTNAEHMGKKYQLQNNITSGITAPLGSSSLKFTGTFDGNDKSITFAQTSTTLDYSGLFSYIGTTGTVKNLTVSFGTLRGRSYSGSLAGYNEGTITNCKATGTTINSSGSYTGGLVGQNTGTISHSSSSGSVTSSGTSQMIGGFVGYMTSGEIVNCHSTANLSYSGTNNAVRMGGFIGQMDNGKISFSSVRCQNVNGSTKNVVGGFVGRIDNGTIETSFSYITTQVYGGMYSGGFAGGLYSGTIKNCFSNIGKLDYGAVGSGFGVNMAGTSAINIINCYAVTYGSNVRTVSGQSSYAFRPGVIDWDGVCNVTNSMGLPYNMQFSTTYELLTHVANDATLTSNARDTYKWDTSIWRFDQAQPLLKTWADVNTVVTVTFDSNLSGVANPASQTVQGTNVTMPSLIDPTDNKVFVGW
ncbi:MAG: InlB B-repeat-containing protein [Clostridiales bacterium]|nr:InlB B-repeat-containing protein [Clostridiales bacterium]